MNRGCNLAVFQGLFAHLQHKVRRRICLRQVQQRLYCHPRIRWLAAYDFLKCHGTVQCENKMRL